MYTLLWYEDIIPLCCLLLCLRCLFAHRLLNMVKIGSRDCWVKNRKSRSWKRIPDEIGINACAHAFPKWCNPINVWDMLYIMRAHMQISAWTSHNGLGTYLNGASRCVLLECGACSELLACLGDRPRVSWVALSIPKTPAASWRDCAPKPIATSDHHLWPVVPHPSNIDRAASRPFLKMRCAQFTRCSTRKTSKTPSSVQLAATTETNARSSAQATTAAGSKATASPATRKSSRDSKVSHSLI